MKYDGESGHSNRCGGDRQDDFDSRRDAFLAILPDLELRRFPLAESDPIVGTITGGRPADAPNDIRDGNCDDQQASDNCKLKLRVAGAGETPSRNSHPTNKADRDRVHRTRKLVRTRCILALGSHYDSPGDGVPRASVGSGIALICASMRPQREQRATAAAASACSGRLI